MNNSQIHYQNLIKIGEDRLNDFFKNVELFESQFKYQEVNKSCYTKMYLDQLNGDSYRARQDYFKDISDLEGECKKCWKYYLKPRNKSIKGLDLQLGKILEEIFIDYFKILKIKIIRADLKDRRYPDLLILDGSKEIIGYIELKYHGAPFVMAYKMRPGRECYEGSITLDKEKISKQIKIIYGELDRPVFFVHWVDFPCLKGVFFQTSEEICNSLLNDTDIYYRKHRDGDFEEKKDGSVKKVGYIEKIYPSIVEMGNFEHLIKIINEKK